MPNVALGRARARRSKIALLDCESSQFGFDFADDLWIQGDILLGSLGTGGFVSIYFPSDAGMSLNVRPSSTFFATMVTTARTLELTLYELTLALFTFPPDTGPWLPPDAASDLEILLIIAFYIGIAVGFHVAWVAMGPLGEFGWVSRTLGTAHVMALLT